MRLIVQYSAQARAAAGVGEEPIELPAGAATGDLLVLLTQQRNALAPVLLNGDRTPHSSVLVFVGGEQVCNRAYRLKDGDTVMILPPLSGG